MDLQALAVLASRFDNALRANASRRFTPTPGTVEEVKDARMAAAIAADLPLGRSCGRR